MSKWKETNKYGIHESKAAYRHYTRRRDKEAEILKELEPQPPTHVDLTGLETYIQRLRESKEPTMDDNFLIWFDVETSGLDPMSDNLLEVEARITDMKGLQVPLRRPNIAERGINRNFNKYWDDYYSHPSTYEYHPTLETICERSR